MVNRNKVIGIVIGKGLGYAVQFGVYCKLVEVTSPATFFLIKNGTKYGVKFMNSTAKNYIRTDFRSETIFSEAIDASFFAD
jgi:hypothetical protein